MATSSAVNTRPVQWIWGYIWPGISQTVQKESINGRIQMMINKKFHLEEQTHQLKKADIYFYFLFPLRFNWKLNIWFVFIFIVPGKVIDFCF